MSQVGRKLPIKTKILPQRRASQWQEAAPNWRLSTDPFIRPFPCAQSVLGVPGPLSPLLSALAPPPLATAEASFQKQLHVWACHRVSWVFPRRRQAPLPPQPDTIADVWKVAVSPH